MKNILSNLILRRELKTHALALDISTESILGGFYEKGGLSYHAKPKQPAVFDYPIRFVCGPLIKERGSDRANRLFKSSISNAFAGFYKQIKHADFLYVNFSDPFVVDRVFTKKMARNTSETISASEIANLRREIEVEANKAVSPLIAVGAETLIQKVNGYNVENAVGYKGKTLELEVFLNLISPEIKTILEAARERFFPRSSLHCFSDSRLIWRVLRADVKISASPCQVLDIDGEVTGVYFWAGALPPQHIATIPFGSRTLERKLASIMRLTEEDSRSLLARHADGVLDNTLVQKIETSVFEAIRDWGEQVTKSTVGQMITRDAGFVVFGRSPRTKLFYEFLKKEAGSEKTVIFTGRDFMLKAMVTFCGF